MYLYYVLLIYSFDLIFAQEIPDFNNLNINDIQSQLPAEFGNANLTLNDAKTIIRDKCIEAANGDKELGSKHFENIEDGTQRLMECISSIVNYTAIQEEIEEAKPRGELDAVFHKYCSKRPEALKCIEDFNTLLVPCLDFDERENKDVFMRIVTSLLNFICHKGGDQIALFIAEKGPECLQSKKDNLQQCLNDTLSEYIPKDGLENLKSQKLPKFVMGKKQCADLQRMEICIVNHLEKCNDITPANLVESMFRFIRNETICRNTIIMKANGATQHTNSLLCILLSIILHKLLKIIVKN